LARGGRIRAAEVSIASGLKKTVIAMGLKSIEMVFAVGRALRAMGCGLDVVTRACGRRIVRFYLPVYRVWRRIRRAVIQSPESIATRVFTIVTSRAVVTTLFVIGTIGVAAQTLQAREHGGFVGERPFLTAFITSDTDEVAEEVVVGPATRMVQPTFQAASVSSAIQPTVLGEDVIVESPTSLSGFAFVQPIITDAAVADHGRKGVTTYTVESGDTTSSIAERFGLRTSTILWSNKLSAWSIIRPGQDLNIPPVDGVVHTVVKNDTLVAIAKKYRSDAEEVLEFNRLLDADDIAIGDVLMVPGGQPPQVIAPKIVAPRVVVPAKPLPSIPGKFFWPSVSGYRISQYYTWRHHGIDIAVTQGTPIFASEDGVVTSSGWLGGYGYQVMIDHGNGLQSRYAHNSKLLVRRGAKVTRGQQIALVGSTGRSTGPHIHYEIYANGKRVNPFTYLR
jgi:murein DD-endopeptidase MepM/ murein hydrolase activator NlpD